MKKKLLFLMLSVLTIGAWADTYTPVEYIATTTDMKDGDSNSNVPYLNTGYVHTASTKIEMECIITANQKNWEALFGTRNGDGNTTNGAFVFFWRTNGNNVGCYNRGNGETTGSNAIPTNERIKVFANPTSLTIKKVSDNSNVTTINTSNACAGNPNKPIYIFDTNTTNQSGLHPDGSRTYMKLYSFKIYEGDNLVSDYVPVKRSDNKTGLYDLKNNTFISSATSKDFAAGDEVGTTIWDSGDAILPSIKYGGSYSAYTWTKDLGHGWADANFNEIAGTPDDNNGKKWYEQDYALATGWTYGNSVLPNSWSDKMGDIYVRRHFIIASGTSLPATVYMPAPHDDAPCEYYINGTLVWRRTGNELAIGADASEKYGKANGWYEGEVIRLTNEQKALIKTDGSVNVFAFHVHQNWGGRYADGGLYGDAGTDGTPSKQFKDNYPEIDALISLCEAENTTSDAAFQTAINNAKAHQNMLQNTTNRFNDLVVARKHYLAERRSEDFVGSAPEAGKDYYLYNVGQRQFLGGGNDHGTKVSLVYASNAMTLEADNGKFKINTHRITGDNNVGYVGTDEYIDAVNGASFTFTETSTGSKTYKISYADGKYLGYKANTYNRVVIDNTDANSTNNHWKLITKAEFDALQNTATVSNPVDATYLISNPGYERGMARGDWTYVGCSTEGLSDAYNNDSNYPDYVVTGMASGEMSVSRTLTGLKPGLYKVSVQACYRDGDNFASASHKYNTGENPIRNAKLLVGYQSADIKTVVECAGSAPGYGQTEYAEYMGGTYPDTGPRAAEFFEVGQFWTSIDNVVVGVDGSLTIAVKRDSEDHIDSDWIAVDNWRLTYYGPEPWNGTDDAILPSIKYGGSYSAYTWTRDSGVQHPNNDVNYAHFNEIVGTPANDSSNKAWFETDYVPSSEWTFGNSVLPSSWSSNYGDIYVRRPFVIAAGSTLPSTIYMPAPHDDAPCEYYINGTLVWSRTGSEPGVNGWKEDEVVRLTDAQKALIHTDGTVNVFAFHVHQNWGGRYADGGLYGDAETEGSPSKVFVSNNTRIRLENAVNEAEAEGLSANADVIRAKTSLNWLQDASYNLEKIRYVIRQHNALRHDYSTLASAEPSDGLEVYIFNVGAGMFLAGGNDWGTHMSLRGQISHWPMKLHSNSSGSNRYTIQSNLPNGTRGTNDGMGHNGYVDCGTWNTTDAGWAWEFQAVGDGSYRIINCGDDGTVTDKYLGMTEDYRFQVDTDKTGADNVYNHWKFFTKAQLDALLTTATPSNPADASYYIHQATFQQNDFEDNSKGEANANFNKSKWEATLGGIYNWKENGVSGDYAYEYYNNPESTTSSVVKLSQTVTGLPAGLYRVTCNGLYRDGGHSAALAAGSCVSKAYLYAGTTSNKVLLPSIFDGKNKGAGYGNLDGGVDCIIPNGPGDAVRFFQNGQYLVSIDVEVGDDGECEIGMIRPAEGANSGEWMCVDNFQMYYLGAPITLSEDATVNPNINTSTYKVTLTRTLKAGKWNTFCVPFAIEKSLLGANAEVKELTGATNNGDNYTMTFSDASSIEAGKPYMVRVAENEYNGTIEIENASGIAVNTTGTPSVTEDGVTFTGVYANGNAPLGSFIISNNVFYNVDSDVTLKAFRGYITVSSGDYVKALDFTFDDDDATAIEMVNGQSSMVNGSIYNLAGQRLSKTQKGINIVNGKKIMVK